MFPRQRVDVGRSLVEVGKERCLQPLREELVDRQPPRAGRLQAGGEGVVGVTTRRPFGGVVDPRVRADEHEALHPLGAGEGRVEGDAAPHGVADVGRVTPRGGDEAPGVDEVPHLDGGGPPVTGQVDPDDLVVPGECRRDRAPGAPGLREAVDEDDACSRTGAHHGEGARLVALGVASGRGHRP